MRTPDQKTVVVGTQTYAAMRAEWMKAVGPLVNPAREPEGAGWLTSVELRAILGCGKSKYTRTLKALAASGKVETFGGTQRNEAGNVSPQWWYRLKQ